MFLIIWSICTLTNTLKLRIAEGSEAGIGPVFTLVLAQEFLPMAADHLVFVAGGIGCWRQHCQLPRNGRKRRATGMLPLARPNQLPTRRSRPRSSAPMRCCGQRASRSAPAVILVCAV